MYWVKKLIGINLLMLVSSSILITNTGSSLTLSDSNRKALVIGNANYPKRGKFVPLPNPLNNAQAIAQRLREYGFAVTKVIDVNSIAMKDAIDKFTNSLNIDDVALVYFSGHGIVTACYRGEEQKNFLIPVQSVFNGKADICEDAVPAQWLINLLNARNGGTNILLLDTCRNLLLEDQGTSNSGEMVTMKSAGTFIGYASAPGRTSKGDEESAYSVFTEQFLEKLSDPHDALPLELLFKDVRTAVATKAEELGFEQVPWDDNGLVGENFCFRIPCKSLVAPADTEEKLQQERQEKERVEAENRQLKEQLVQQQKQKQKPFIPVHAPIVLTTNIFIVIIIAWFSWLLLRRIPKLVSPVFEFFIYDLPKKYDLPEKIVKKPVPKPRIVTPSILLPEKIPLPEMVTLKPGKFKMGDIKYSVEKPIHEVTIGYPFAIGKYQVTFDEYDAFCAATNNSKLRLSKRNKPDDEGWGRGRRPVINITLDDAVAYCAWLSAQTAHTYRLPSEAEWEYACRAGTTTEYSFGDDANKLGEYAWFYANSSGKTHPVGEKKPNPWDLYDMHGNVWEWCQDTWHKDYAGAPTDGSAWKAGDSNSYELRGGSWFDTPAYCRSANRNYYGYSRGSRGFRVVAVVSPEDFVILIVFLYFLPFLFSYSHLVAASDSKQQFRGVLV